MKSREESNSSLKSLGGFTKKDDILMGNTTLKERIRNAIAERKFRTMCLFDSILLLWLSKLKLLWRDSDVLHRPCFVYLLLVRACIERNPGPETIRDRVFEIKLDDPTMLEQLRTIKTKKTLDGIFSFMEGYIRNKNMESTTLFLYVRSDNRNELHCYMILTLSSWPEMNSIGSDHCTQQSQFLAYRNQNDFIVVCPKFGNTNGFDCLNGCIEKVKDIVPIPFTQSINEHLYQQFCNSVRVQTSYSYYKNLFDTGNPIAPEEILHEDCDVLLVKHFLCHHECTYTTQFGFIRCLDASLKLIVTNTEVTPAMVQKLAQSNRMVKDVVEGNSGIINGDMGFEMEQFHVAVLSLANIGCHKPEIDDIVSELQSIDERGGIDACRSNLIFIGGQ
ncbi:uncharacterized protein LOC127849715 [Dreissena polymorpha]|uniref:uncharacterized protein LOC127849715 n=1 Tax=Dreissena polymorpha TaxID=45954 RepID=UPI0022645BEC|nr:uncharacterized protein LOC127849715 [Dreissena polymorpha]